MDGKVKHVFSTVITAMTVIAMGPLARAGLLALVGGAA
jgi:hypothetical protein